MPTSYEQIYNKFSNLISDFNIDDFDDYIIEDMLESFLKTAIVRVRRCQHDLSDRDDEKKTFNVKLSDIEIELLADGMVLAWLEPKINSTQNVLQFVGGKEEKMFSQANHLAELRQLKKDIIRDMKQLHSDYTYSHNPYLNK